MKKPLYESLQNAATGVFNEIVSLVAEASEGYAAWRDCGRPALSGVICGLILSTEENREWAAAIESRYADEFHSVYPDTQLDLEVIHLTGNEAHMMSALLSHPAIVGADKERFSFVITPGYTEGDLFNTIRKGLDLAIVQLYCVAGPADGQFLAPQSGLGGVHNTPMAGRDYALAIRALAPQYKKVCVALSHQRDHFSEQKALQRHRAELITALQGQGLEVVEHWWDFANLYENDLEEILKEVDVLITFDEPVVSRHRSRIAALCDIHKTLFCASELDSVLKGAALGCGLTKEAYVKPLISVVHRMMIDDALPHYIQIPMQVGMRYNWAALKRQGVAISPTIKALMEMKAAHDESAIQMVGAGEQVED